MAANDKNKPPRRSNKKQQQGKQSNVYGGDETLLQGLIKVKFGFTKKVVDIFRNKANISRRGWEEDIKTVKGMRSKCVTPFVRQDLTVLIEKLYTLLNPVYYTKEYLEKKQQQQQQQQPDNNNDDDDDDAKQIIYDNDDDEEDKEESDSSTTKRLMAIDTRFMPKDPQELTSSESDELMPAITKKPMMTATEQCTQSAKRTDALDMLCLKCGIHPRSAFEYQWLYQTITLFKTKWMKHITTYNMDYIKYLFLLREKFKGFQMMDQKSTESTTISNAALKLLNQQNKKTSPVPIIEI